MNNSLKKTRLLGFVFLILFAAGAWYFLLGPRLSEPAALQATADSALEQKTLLDTQLTILQRREQFIDDAEKVAGQLEGRFPWQPDVPTLINQVQRAAERAGMAPDQVLSVVPGKPTSEGILIPQAGGGASAGDSSGATPETPAEGGDEASGGGEASGEEPAPAPSPSAPPTPALAKMGVDIVVVGTYDQITRFLSELRNSNRVIVTDTVQVSEVSATTPDALPSSQFQANISAYAVLLPKPPQPPVVNTESRESGGQEADEPSPSQSPE